MQAVMILKRNTKNQAPNPKKIPNSKLQTAARASSLELFWSLELGVWNLELVAWLLRFSKIEMLPHPLDGGLFVAGHIQGDKLRR